MSEDSQPSNETSEVRRKPIVVESKTAADSLEGDRDLAFNKQAESTDEPEVVRKPIVIPVEPEAEEEKDSDRTPKNTNAGLT
jgi:hypothetical protein